MSKYHKQHKQHKPAPAARQRAAATPPAGPSQGVAAGAGGSAAAASGSRPAPTLSLSAPHVWCFEALDTWFFRESRPLEAVGGAQLTSHFPPPARTLIGAIRGTLGDAAGVDWPHYRRDADHPLRRRMGGPDDLGPLRFTGPYPLKGGQRLYPAPLLLMRGSETAAEGAERAVFTRLQPSEAPVHCDLGHVRLPVKARDLPGARPLEGQWLSAAGLQAVLQGRDPALQDVFKAEDLFQPEPRLGIAIDARTRRPLDGLLYQTRHIRPGADTAVGITLAGLDPSAWTDPPLGTQGLARLGGEGRPAAWRCQPVHPLPRPELPHGHRQLLMCLLTPARFTHGWLPDGFEPETDAQGQTTGWQGQLAGRPVRLVCAVTGKPVREGGWDLAAAGPRDLRAGVSAGSCYFLAFDRAEDARGVADECHGSQIGLDTAWGGGQVAFGRW